MIIERTRVLVILLSVISLSYSCSKESETSQIASQNLLSFEKTYGGYYDDVANSGIIFEDELYIIGSTQPNKGANKMIYLIKTDLNGNEIFNKVYGGLGDDEGIKIISTQDDNFFIIGSTIKEGDIFKDVMALKIDHNGNVLWEKTFGGFSNDFPMDVLLTKNGEFCILGATGSYGAGGGDIYLIWMDQSGNILREKFYGQSDLDAGSSMLEMENGDLIVFGYTNNYGAVSRDYYLMKLSATGDSIWAKRYGGSDYEESQEIVRTSEGGFLMNGHSASTDPNHNMYAVKVDVDGNIIWERNYGGALHDGGQSVLINSESEYVFVARSDSYGMGQGIYMVTTDTAGNILSESVFDGHGDDRIDEIIEYGNSYFLIGQSNSFDDGDYDVYLIKHPK